MRQVFICMLLSVSFVVNGQLITDSLLIDGHYRSFHFYQPKKPISNGCLMFIMHGSGGNGKQMLERTQQLEMIAPGEGLLIVYPNGYKNYWNECRKYASSEANKMNIDETAFFDAMIKYFHENHGISKKKVVAGGFSGGGHMAYKLGLSMPGKIKAIAAVVANMPDSSSSDCIPANKSLPVLIINGTEDNVNPWEGGEMFVNNSSYGVVRSSQKSFQYWSDLAGYTGKPFEKILTDTDPHDNRTIHSYSFIDDNKPVITLLEVKGGKHDYPGDIDVWRYAWEFFRSNVNEISISKADPSKPVQVVDAACGQCQLGLPGKSCDLAVRINGKVYFVQGTSIDDHGDAHAKDGFCESVRKARVQGRLQNGYFLATYMELLTTPGK